MGVNECRFLGEFPFGATAFGLPTFTWLPRYKMRDHNQAFMNYCLLGANA